MIRRLCFLLFLVLSCGTTVAHGEVQSARARDIQAAFLVRFGQYVKWPGGAFTSPDAPLVIGILGRDPFGSHLDRIARSLRINGRDIEIRRFQHVASLRPVHILFVSSDAVKQMDRIQTLFSGHPVLFVGDTPGFLDKAGTINFVMKGKKIRFDISRTNARLAGLRISSKLLSVARTIR